MPYDEKITAALGAIQTDFYARMLEKSKEFREGYYKKKNIIHSEEMPWEDSPQGRIKHLVNEDMDTAECCMDMYMQFIEPGGRSGKHRHMAEEVFFVLEGKGHDLHWDALFKLEEKFIWYWEPEPKKFEWEEGDFVYIPPYAIHQHFNTDPANPARFITGTSRLVKALGMDWWEQVENAPGYKDRK
jgi:quercetin dioxygenase-like cupin family protein